MRRQLTMLTVLLTVAFAACSGNEDPRTVADAAPETPEVTGTMEEDGNAAEAARREAAEARRAAAEERRRVREILTRRVHFAYDEAELSAEAERILLAKAEVLRAYPEVTLRIEGHADERGSIEYNLALGQRRANAVRRFLTGYGIDADRLLTVSFGEERPLVRANTPAAYAQNRRAEFVITGAGERLEGLRASR